MNVLITEKDDVMIVMPGIRFDTNTAPEVEKEITQTINAGSSKIVVDFSKTDYISSAGLRVLLKTAKLITEKKGSFALCNGNEQIEEVLEISGFLSMLTYCKKLDEAMSKVSA